MCLIGLKEGMELDKVKCQKKFIRTNNTMYDNLNVHKRK